MGFPYDKADWSVVDGAMFMGAGSSMPFFYTIIAIIIFLDTFKYQLNNYIPGINSVLNNLYETLKDLSLFFKDLVN